MNCSTSARLTSISGTAGLLPTRVETLAYVAPAARRSQARARGPYRGRRAARGGRRRGRARHGPGARPHELLHGAGGVHSAGRPAPRCGSASVGTGIRACRRPDTGSRTSRVIWTPSRTPMARATPSARRWGPARSATSWAMTRPGSIGSCCCSRPRWIRSIGGEGFVRTARCWSRCRWIARSTRSCPSPARAAKYRAAPWLRELDVLLWQDMNAAGVAKRAPRDRGRRRDPRSRAPPQGRRAGPDHRARGRPDPSRRGRADPGRAAPRTPS